MPFVTISLVLGCVPFKSCVNLQTWSHTESLHPHFLFYIAFFPPKKLAFYLSEPQEPSFTMTWHS